MDVVRHVFQEIHAGRLQLYSANPNNVVAKPPPPQPRVAAPPATGEFKTPQAKPKVTQSAKKSAIKKPAQSQDMEPQSEQTVQKKLDLTAASPAKQLPINVAEPPIQQIIIIKDAATLQYLKAYRPDAHEPEWADLRYSKFCDAVRPPLLV
jgi:hypothetical protein